MPDKEEEIKKLKFEVEKTLQQFASSSEQIIQNRSQILNAAVNESIKLHSDQIRNLGLISGVVAPFSLALLQIKLDISVFSLLTGFILLVVNIVLSQYLLVQELNRKNKIMGGAFLEFVSASISKMMIEDQTLESSDRTLKTADFVRNIYEFDKLLNINPHSVEPMHINNRLRTYSAWSVGIFAFGCALIILSIFLNPFISLIVNIATRIH